MRRKAKRFTPDERDRAMRRLAVIGILVLWPALGLWTLASHLGWLSHQSGRGTPLDVIVEALFAITFLYFGFVTHVLIGRVHIDTWIRHAQIAAPGFSAVLLLYVFHFSGASSRFAEAISSLGIDEKLSSIFSNIISWAISGVVGNFVYDLLKRIFKRQSASKRKGKQVASQ